MLTGHPWKALVPIVVTELPIVTDVSDVHALNAPSPIDVTESGIDTLVSAVCWKAVAPIVRSPVPSVTDAKLEHSLKAPIPILSTESGIVTDVKLVH